MISKEQLCLIEGTPDPCAIVIFGASGDLAHRKLLPSLYHLFTHRLLPKNFYIVGVARTVLSTVQFKEKVLASISKIPSDDANKKQDFVDRCVYLSGEYTAPAVYGTLKRTLDELDQKFKVNGCRVFYLSVPPSLYSPVVQHLGASGLAKSDDLEKQWVRVVIEKPFGRSFSSAAELNTDLQRVLSEKQIYRIDHYLGKETVQNILMFRFANVMFEPVWNRNFVDHVRITATEQLGVEHRAGYYEQAGVIRDMMQNHLLQLVSLIGMEPPSSLDADVVRDRRSEVLHAIRILKGNEVPENSIVGQYDRGEINGNPVIAYTQEENVSKQSKIATFCALHLEIDNWRWQGVPFYLRSGKRMAERKVEIAVQFKKVPTSIFRPLTADMLTPNQLVFRIQPDEGITIRFEAKKPGPKLCMATVSMDFGFEEAFKTPQPESYARLFHDAMLGDQTLFARSDEIKASWQFIDPILNFWEAPSSSGPRLYPSGSWGPSESEALLSRYGHSWSS